MNVFGCNDLLCHVLSFCCGSGGRDELESMGCVNHHLNRMLFCPGANLARLWPARLKMVRVSGPEHMARILASRTGRSVRHIDLSLIEEWMVRQHLNEWPDRIELPQPPQPQPVSFPGTAHLWMDQFEQPMQVIELPRVCNPYNEKLQSRLLRVLFERRWPAYIIPENPHATWHEFQSEWDQRLAPSAIAPMLAKLVGSTRLTAEVACRMYPFSQLIRRWLQAPTFARAESLHVRASNAPTLCAVPDDLCPRITCITLTDANAAGVVSGDMQKVLDPSFAPALRKLELVYGIRPVGIDQALDSVNAAHLHAPHLHITLNAHLHSNIRGPCVGILGPGSAEWLSLRLAGVDLMITNASKRVAFNVWQTHRLLGQLLESRASVHAPVRIAFDGDLCDGLETALRVQRPRRSAPAPTVSEWAHQPLPGLEGVHQLDIIMHPLDWAPSALLANNEERQLAVTHEPWLQMSSLWVSGQWLTRGFKNIVACGAHARGAQFV